MTGTGTDTAPHLPVLLERCLDLLAPTLERPGAVLVDATLGAGGHSLAALQRFPGLRVVGLDRDADALALAGERLAPFAERSTLLHTGYADFADALGGIGIEAVDATLFDLGVSSMQLDLDARGFAYSRESVLDMRMDRRESGTAADLVNGLDERALARLLREYGEEPLAGRYARAIVAARATAPITTSTELVAVLEAATPAAARRPGHVAKRVFQALRIEVNGELAQLAAALPAALDALAIGGRIVVLAYHSLEDRIAKRAIAGRTVSTAPRGLPVEPEADRPTFRTLIRGTPSASADEVLANPRAASVRLRAAERIRAGGPTNPHHDRLGDRP